MKKQLLPLLLALLLAEAGFSSNLVWAKSANASAASGYGGITRFSMATDTGLLVIYTGYSLDSLNVDLTGGFTNGINPTGGSTQVILAEYDLAGNLKWHQTWASLGTDPFAVDAITQRASDGHIFLYGTFSTALDADPGAGVVSLTSGAYGAAFLIEVDNTGNYVWAGTLSAALGGLYPANVAITSTGNIMLTGNFESTVNIGFLSDDTISGGTSAGNAFIATYDPTHQLIWGGAIIGDGNNYANINNLVINPYANDFYISGTLYGTANFNILSGTTSVTGNSTQDVFIAHYDANGNYLGIIDMGNTGSSYPDDLQFINLGAGEVILEGSTGGTINLDPAGGGYTVSSPGGSVYHGFVARYDANLNYKWAVSFTGLSDNIHISSPRYDPATGLSMVVYSDTTFNANPGAAMNNIVLSRADAIVLLDYNSASYISSFSYNGSPGYMGNTVAYNGNLYLTGSYYNGFNAALNGSVNILHNSIDSTIEYGTPYLAEYNFLEVQPTTQVSNLHFTAGADTTVTIAFTPGNGQQRLVLVTEDSAVTDTADNGYLTLGDSDFEYGAQFVHGAHVAYLDSGQGFTLTGIDTTGGHKYYFKAFEVNGGFVYGVQYPTANFNLNNPPTAVYPVPVISGIFNTQTVKLELYPNPASDMLIVQATGAAENAVMRISNTEGQTVMELKTGNAPQQQINISNLGSGVYLLSLVTEAGTSTARFVKQ